MDYGIAASAIPKEEAALDFSPASLAAERAEGVRK